MQRTYCSVKYMSNNSILMSCVFNVHAHFAWKFTWTTVPVSYRWFWYLIIIFVFLPAIPVHRRTCLLLLIKTIWFLCWVFNFILHSLRPFNKLQHVTRTWVRLWWSDPTIRIRVWITYAVHGSVNDLFCKQVLIFLYSSFECHLCYIYT